MQGIFEKKDHFGLKAIPVSGFRGYSPMFHPHGELIYLSRGSLSLMADGKKYHLEEGELAVIFPYLVHSYQEAPDAEVLLVLFDPAETAFDNTLYSFKPETISGNGRFLEPMIQRTVYWSRRGKIKTAMGYLNAILGEFLETVSLKKSDRRTENNAIRVLAFCSEHYAEPLTIRRVAEELFVSQSYVSKIFSQELRYGFREYLNALRLQKALSLLEQTDKRIVDIMLDCGFENQSSFNRIFRAATGLSPAKYRASRKKAAL